MDFYNFRLPFLVLAALGCCSEGSPILNDKMNGVIGKNVTFKTTITSVKEFVTVTWGFNTGLEIEPIITSILSLNTDIIEDKYTGRISYNNTTCELQLGPLVKEDEGEYILTIVTNKGKQLSGQIDLVVLGCCSEGSPILNDKMNGVIGKNVNFKTTITSVKEFVTVTWGFNTGLEIEPIITSILSTNTDTIEDKYTGRISYNNTTCELQLGPLVKEDEGEYILTIVTNKGKQLSGQIDLVVLGCCSEGSPILNDKMNGVIGKNVTFKTTITSVKEFVTVTWGFNTGSGIEPIITSVPSLNTDTIEDKYTGRISYNNTTCELQLGPLVKEDEGEYILTIVTNKGKQQSGQIDLVVLEPVTDVKISSNLPEAVETNSTVVLTCSAKGSFTYKWLIGSTPLVVDGTHMKLNAVGNELTITEVSRTDLRGPIFCIAENPLESGRSPPFNLTVSCPWPRIQMQNFCLG